MTRTNAPERGSSAVELTLVTPPLLLFLLLMVALGRFANTRADVDAAARDAARAASFARNTDAAQVDAQTAAAATLEQGGVDCRSMTVMVDVTNFTPGGTVAVNVACNVELADVSLLRLPGTKTLAARFVSVIDLYRET